MYGPEQQIVDTTTGDATADFAVRAELPQAVAGTVDTTDGDPVTGVEITLTPPGAGAPEVTTTDADGRYLFDNNAELPGYEVTVTGVPEGFDTVGAITRGFDIDPGHTVPNQDFRVAEQPSVQGTVAGGGSPLGAVAVTIAPAGGGIPVSTSTQGDGGYEFPHVRPGRYDISVDPPEGYRPVADRTDVAVGSTDVAGLDFALTRPGSVSGRVTGPGNRPLGDVAVRVDGDATGEHSLTTDGDGLYFVAGLDPDRYRIDVTSPAGYRVDGSADRAVEITAAGEIRGGLDFELARTLLASTPPTSSPPTSTEPTSGRGATQARGAGVESAGGGLAHTGTGVASLLLAALAALAVGIAITLAGRR